MIATNIVNRVYNVAAYGAVPGEGIDNTRPIQDALASAQQEGGELYFPPGIWEFNETLHLESVGQVASLHGVRGSGWRSELRYMGSGSAFTRAGSSLDLVLSHFKLRGTEQAQAGIDFDSADSSSIGHITIENVFIHRFEEGVGIRLGETYFSRIVHNRIFDTRIGIDCRRSISCEINSNLVRRWQQVGIHIGNPSTQSASNTISANTVDEPLAADNADRAAIWLESTISTVVDGNYFECLGNHQNGNCADGFPHGILIKGETRSQSNVISNNYYSGNNGLKDSVRVSNPDAGFAIFLATNTSRTQITGNQLGSYVIRDDGDRTMYMMAESGEIEGAGVRRSGWSILDGEVVQHHS